MSETIVTQADIDARVIAADEAEFDASLVAVEEMTCDDIEATVEELRKSISRTMVHVRRFTNKETARAELLTANLNLEAERESVIAEMGTLAARQEFTSARFAELASSIGRIDSKITLNTYNAEKIDRAEHWADFEENWDEAQELLTTLYDAFRARVNESE